MARSDLLINLVKAGVNGERELLVRTVEAMIAEEHGKQHHVLAESLTAQLRAGQNGNGMTKLQDSNNRNLVHERMPERKLSDLFLRTEVRTAVCQLIEEQQRADLLRSYNLEPRHRILLTGPPGNGKTSLAEALAESLAIPMFSVRYDALIGSFLGETALRMRQLFDFVRNRRCALFFDEFDTVAKERGDTHETGEIKRVVSSLLLEIDRLPSYVVVITATNHPELLDRAVWRRFQLKLELPKPTREQVTEWLTALEGRLEIDLTTKRLNLAKRLSGLNFSQMEDMAQDILRRKILSEPRDHVAMTHSIIRMWTEAAHRERLSTDGYPASTNIPNSRNSRARNARSTRAKN
jgi:SpoVK/Ycf46/Vps4 family AAA+-type ATPase